MKLGRANFSWAEARKMAKDRSVWKCSVECPVARKGHDDDDDDDDDDQD